MKRVFGTGLLLLLLVMAGCGGGSNLTPKIAISGTIYQDSSNPLNLTTGGAMEVTPLVPSTGGLSQPATVNGTTVNLSNGQFVLNNIPADRCYLLKITYKRSADDPLPLTTYIKANAKDQERLEIIVTPQDWAAGRLAFDLLRNFLDTRLDHNAFIANYDGFFSAIKDNCTSPSFSTWLADTNAFYSYLQNVTVDVSPMASALNNMLQATLVDLDDEDDDLRFILKQYNGDEAPNKWLSDYWIMEDNDYDERISAIGTVNVYRLYAVRQIPTGGPSVIHFRLELYSKRSLTNPAELCLAFRSPASLTPEYTCTFVPASSDSSNKVYYAQVTEDDLTEVYEVYKDENGYYLAQVIPNAALNWPSSDYTSIDLDRSSPFLFKLEAN
ncbi:MAG TPA: hypothetical protein PLI94_08105 [Bacillota bacterium]|nr:hypothetical protein [Bacillota bacterium]